MKIKQFFEDIKAGISPFMAIFILLCWFIGMFVWALIYSDVLQPWEVDSMANASTSPWKPVFWTIVDYFVPLMMTIGAMLYGYQVSQDEN